MVASVPSSARASATDSVTGPRTVAVVVFESLRSADAQIAPEASQSVVAGSDTVTSFSPSGSTVISQRRFFPCSRRLAFRTLPLVTVNVLSRSVR